MATRPKPKQKPKQKRKQKPARVGFGATPILDPGDLVKPDLSGRPVSFFGEPISVPLWWRGPLKPGESQVCHFVADPVLLAPILLSQQPDDPTDGLAFRLPESMHATLEGFACDGPEDLWDVDLVLRIGEKVYGAGPAGALIEWTFPETCRPALREGVVLRVELHGRRLVRTITCSVICRLTLLRPMA